MRLTYLFVDALSAAVPLALAASARLGFGPRWKNAVAAVLVAALPFAAWDAFFAKSGVWGFNPRYLMGPALFGLPLEELLFFLCIPFACLFIYRHVRGQARLEVPAPAAAATWGALAIGLALAALLAWGRIYTASVCALGAATAVAFACFRPAYSGHLLVAIAAQYVPFLIVNGVLTALPIVVYRESAILGWRIHTIPVEDAVYSLVMLAAPVALFEAFTAPGGAQVGNA